MDIWLLDNFSSSNLSLEICYTDRGNDITLKTLKNLENTFNTNLKFNDDFNSITPITGTYSISSGICTITARHSFSKGQSVYLRFTSGNKPTNKYYIIDSVTSTSFTIKVSGCLILFKKTEVFFNAKSRKSFFEIKFIFMTFQIFIH